MDFVVVARFFVQFALKLSLPAYCRYCVGMWVTVYVQFGDCCKQETALTQKNRKSVSFVEFN